MNKRDLWFMYTALMIILTMLGLFGIGEAMLGFISVRSGWTWLFILALGQFFRVMRNRLHFR